MGALIGFGQSMAMIRDYRVVSIVGAYGKHKTSLAFRIAWEFYKAGLVDRVISNCPSVWTEDLGTLQIPDVTKTRAALILDEGGLFLESRHDVKSFMAALRKLDIYLIIPTATTPALKVRTLLIQNDMKFTHIGVPLLRYVTMLDDSVSRLKSRFWWFRPDTYGIYDTVALPVDATEIDSFLAGLKDRLSEKTVGKSYSNTKAAGKVRYGQVLGVPSDVSAMEDIAHTVTQSVQAMEEMNDTLDHKLKVIDQQVQRLEKRKNFISRVIFGK